MISSADVSQRIWPICWNWSLYMPPFRPKRRCSVCFFLRPMLAIPMYWNVIGSDAADVNYKSMKKGSLHTGMLLMHNRCVDTGLSNGVQKWAGWDVFLERKIPQHHHVSSATVVRLVSTGVLLLGKAQVAQCRWCVSWKADGPLQQVNTWPLKSWENLDWLCGIVSSEYSSEGQAST